MPLKAACRRGLSKAMHEPRANLPEMLRDFAVCAQIDRLGASGQRMGLAAVRRREQEAPALCVSQSAQLHDIAATDQGRHGEPISDGLAKSRQVGSNAKIGLGAL